jgi:hypothetical protein
VFYFQVIRGLIDSNPTSKKLVPKVYLCVVNIKTLKTKPSTELLFTPAVQNLHICHPKVKNIKEVSPPL